MKKWITLLLTVMLVFTWAAALADTWFCPNCGQRNDSNFCPACGTPKPGGGSGSGTTTTTTVSTSDLKVTRAVLNSDGSVSVSWSGGKSPYNMYYSWYANSNHNSGADVTLWRGGSGLIGTSLSLTSDLVPGERYWIIIEDADGHEAWYDFNPGRKAFTELSGTRLTFSLRKKVNNRSSTVGSFSANEIERQYLSSMYGGTIKMNVGRLKNTYYFTARMAIFLPSGEPYLFHKSDEGINGTAYWESYDFKYVWDWLVNRKGGIPTGQYTFRLYANDGLFGEEYISMN